LKTAHPQFLEGVRNEKALAPPLEAMLKEALTSFQSTFA